MKVLIFGATGLLGKALMREWAGDPNVVGLGSRDADLRSPTDVERKVGEHPPDSIVLAAAYVFDRTDAHPEPLSLASDATSTTVSVAGITATFPLEGEPSWSVRS